MKDEHPRARICFLISGLARGGAETQLVRLTSALSQRGWKVCLISMLPVPRGMFREQLQKNNVLVKSLNGRRKSFNPRLFFTLVRLLARLRPHVLIGFMFHANIASRVLGRIARIPVILSSVRGEQFATSPLDGNKARVNVREKLLKWTDFLCDSTVTVSRAQYNDMQKANLVPGNRMCVIPSGVDTTLYTPDMRTGKTYRAQTGFDADLFVWLCVGRFEPVKGTDVLLKAFKEHHRANQHSRLILVGDGPLRAQYASWVKANGLEQVVLFTGLRDDVPAWYQMCDAVVLASHHEGLPNVLLEAHAAGKPVVSTNSGSQGEVVLENESGFLVPPGVPEELSGAMNRMIGLSPAQRAEMGSKGRAHIERSFSVPTLVSRWEELMNRLLRRKWQSCPVRPVKVVVPQADVSRRS